MPIALTPEETFEYQLLEDRKDGKENPDGTFFKLRGLTPLEEAEIGDRFFTYRGDGTVESVNFGTSGYKRLMKSLVGWRNFNDKAGNPVAFGPKADENLARLTQRQRGELTRAQKEHFSVTADEGN